MNKVLRTGAICVALSIVAFGVYLSYVEYSEPPEADRFPVVREDGSPLSWHVYLFEEGETEFTTGVLIQRKPFITEGGIEYVVNNEVRYHEGPFRVLRSARTPDGPVWEPYRSTVKERPSR